MSKRISSIINIPDLNKNNQTIGAFKLLSAFLEIWKHGSQAFTQKRIHQLGLMMALGLLTAFGHRTISRALCARAEQFRDWCRSYRFFSKAKWTVFALQHIILCECVDFLDPNMPLVVAWDDTHIPKTGRKIPGVGKYYDPKSPRYAPSFATSLRFITASILLTSFGYCGPARGIPIRFNLAPTLAKPKRRATEEQKQEYKRCSKNWNLFTQTVEQMQILRAEMDAVKKLKDRLLVFVTDAGFCNNTVFHNLPERTVLITRTRKDIRLFAPVEIKPASRGHRLYYGEALPTPEDIRKNPDYPWKKCIIFAANDWHELRYKSVCPVLWKKAGGKRFLRLIVIEPLHYRLRKDSKLLYRDPAYLLVSSIDYPEDKAIQDYFHRWEIEVNHRDQKTILGLGDAQVRNRISVSRQFSFCSIIYSFLLLASLHAYGPNRGEEYLPQPKWRTDPPARASALDIVSQFRLELWTFEMFQSAEELIPMSVFNTNASEFAWSEAGKLAQTIPKWLNKTAWSAMFFADA